MKKFLWLILINLGFITASFANHVEATFSSSACAGQAGFPLDIQQTQGGTSSQNATCNTSQVLPSDSINVVVTARAYVYTYFFSPGCHVYARYKIIYYNDGWDWTNLFDDTKRGTLSDCSDTKSVTLNVPVIDPRGIGLRLTDFYVETAAYPDTDPNQVVNLHISFTE